MSEYSELHERFEFFREIVRKIRDIHLAGLPFVREQDIPTDDKVKMLRQWYDEQKAVLTAINDVIISTRPDLWGGTYLNGWRNLLSELDQYAALAKNRKVELNELDNLLNNAGFEGDSTAEKLERVIDAERVERELAAKLAKRQDLIRKAMRDNGDSLTVQVKIESILRGDYDNE